MRDVDLFSGIGGFALAARWAGLETIQFVEIDPFAQRVLRKNFPDVPIHTDIRDFDATQFQRTFLLTGGYPCQPFSQAGKRGGEGDDRHLWPEMLRVIRECRPTWVLAENVAGHITMGLDTVLVDLESEGYACRTFVIPACAKDAPHRRDRVWIVAHSDGSRWDTQSLSRTICTGGKNDTDIDQPSEGLRTGIVAHSQSKRSHRWPSKSRKGESEQSGVDNHKEENRSEVWSNATGCGEQDAEDVAYSNSTGCQEQWRTISDGEEQSAAECRGRWLPEPNVCRVAHGIPNRVDRLRGLGNSIVPQVAYEIIRAITWTN